MSKIEPPLEIAQDRWKMLSVYYTFMQFREQLPGFMYRWECVFTPKRKHTHVPLNNMCIWRATFHFLFTLALIMQMLYVFAYSCAILLYFRFASIIAYTRKDSFQGESFNFNEFVSVFKHIFLCTISQFRFSEFTYSIWRNFGSRMVQWV